MSTLSVVQRKLLARAQETYASHLTEAEEYLVGRGIDLAAARSAGLGVVRDPLPGHERLVGRLAIPYMTGAGCVNMNFRCLAKHDCKEAKHGKYQHWAGLSSNLYNVQALDSAGTAIAIAEGEIDALSSTLAGIPCVGVPGATKWEDHWNLIFEDFTRVYVWQEGDDAGKKFADRVVQETNAIRVELPAGADVNSTWVASGTDALRARIRR
ncbi:DNA primase [Streptomyces phage Olicious]|uniref:DNA primase n=7 Tax=Immanueltrevirus immanuel3 TaxID=2846399 RepID=A0A2H5BMN8_9CAUD|nr:DNA primase [Streptomyces phage Immanuel3]AUG87362.1 DNA primase [Streptomyces phage HaugeAnator]AUG87426.1 DNA primase [Streptomyces phage Percastrophe]AUG87491.1 DNA primase [Streptomyces phage Romero]AUG87554.1 DNA primase [Streptomyces phage ToriToki]AUG87619.1 DNA primase [Streptomyces phage ZooBear]AZF95846.1 DNA primase [Streptomyces phage Olicious]UVK59131.1 DNA primase [Streptomyces phage JPandJE]